MIEGAVILLVGVIVGRFLPGRRRRPQPELVKGPICGCRHHASLHELATGRCHGGFTEFGRRAVNSVPLGGTKCNCRQYTGPTPLPDYYAPEIGA